MEQGKKNDMPANADSGTSSSNSTSNIESTNPPNTTARDPSKQWKVWAWLKTKFPDAKDHDIMTGIFTGAIALATVVYMGVSIFTLLELRSGWSKIQTQLIFSEQRPLISVKMLDSIHVEIGKPVTANVEVVNYGKEPGWAWARIRVEMGPKIIENFRDALNDKATFEKWRIWDTEGIHKILIPPGVGSKVFPTEQSQKILTPEDMNAINAGTADVAVYGAIFYTSLNNRAEGKNNYGVYPSTFCFYRLKDGTVSGCTNRQGAYTNFAP